MSYKLVVLVETFTRKKRCDDYLIRSNSSLLKHLAQMTSKKNTKRLKDSPRMSANIGPNTYSTDMAVVAWNLNISREDSVLFFHSNTPPDRHSL